MKKIGDITDSADENGEFTNGRASAGKMPTQLLAEWFNSVQREILNVLVKADIPQSKTKEDQLAEAIIKLINSAGYLPTGYSYSKKESNDRFQLVGDYATNTALRNGLDLKVDKANIIQSTGTSTTQIMSQKAVTDAILASYPVGSPIPWAQSTAPAGYLVCNGQSFNKATYPLLAKAYPSGVLPEMRAEFIRGADAGRGIDVGRTILSSQLDAMEKIYGTTSTDSLNNTASGPFRLGNGNGNQAASNQGGSRLLIFDTSRSNRTANENRPRNIAFLYIVRAA